MKFLAPFYKRNSDGLIEVSPEQGSRFAKSIANDYNPIHNPESRRFCVPGDLLFSMALAEYGLHRQMHFEFLDLVGGKSALRYSKPNGENPGNALAEKQSGKQVLNLDFSGGATQNEAKIEQFLRAYVAFSGHNFPHILVPLMKQHNAMINPNRPMVIYKNMSFELDTLEFSDLRVVGADTAMQVDGRRGDVKLGFSLYDGETMIGAGSKNLTLGGLREYDDDVMDELCSDYLSRIPA